MMIRTLFCILGVSLLMIITCCKPADKPQPDTCIGLHNEQVFKIMKPDTCMDIPPEGGQLHPREAPRFAYTDGRFHPNGKEEIVYIQHDTEASPTTRKLFRIDLCTGEKTFLADQVWFPPSWHSNGWITFGRSDRQIWKVKENGDSLTQLTFTGRGYDPHWHPSGEQILYWTNSYGVVSVMADGSSFDTLGLSRHPYISPDGTKLPVLFKSAVGNDKLGYYDFDTESYTELIEIKNSVHEITWSHDSRVLRWSEFQPESVVYTMDIQTLEKKILIEGCESKLYSLVSSANNGKKLLFGRSRKVFNFDTGVLWSENILTVTDQNGENGIDIHFDD